MSDLTVNTTAITVMDDDADYIMSEYYQLNLDCISMFTHAKNIGDRLNRKCEQLKAESAKWADWKQSGMPRHKYLEWKKENQHLKPLTIGEWVEQNLKKVINGQTFMISRKHSENFRALSTYWNTVGSQCFNWEEFNEVLPKVRELAIELQQKETQQLLEAMRQEKEDLKAETEETVKEAKKQVPKGKTTEIFVTRTYGDKKQKIYFATEEAKEDFIRVEKGWKDAVKLHEENYRAVLDQQHGRSEAFSELQAEKNKIFDELAALKANPVLPDEVQKKLEAIKAESAKKDQLIETLVQSNQAIQEQINDLVDEQLAEQKVELAKQKEHLKALESSLRGEIKSQVESDYQNRLSKLKDAENVFKAKSAEEIVNAISRMDKAIQKSLVPELITMLQGMEANL